MPKGYAGIIKATVKCPECGKENHEPHAMTDGRKLYAVCPVCGSEAEYRKSTEDLTLEMAQFMHQVIHNAVMCQALKCRDCRVKKKCWSASGEPKELYCNQICGQSLNWLNEQETRLKGGVSDG